jgi:AraC family transcriptional regulator
VALAAGIETGTLHARGQRVGSWEISDIAFAPGARLRWHFHRRSCLAVVIGGDVRKRFARREEDAREGTVIEMPAAEPHEDSFGCDGARIVVIESEDEAGALHSFRDWRATVLAHRVSRELARPDAYTGLALEGLALELQAAVSRSRDDGAHEPRLDAVRELLAADLSCPPSLSELAREIGLHPSHLARLFRARYGQSIGEYGRGLRLEWAAHRVACSDDELAWIASSAGFADQSHFTREFKRSFGVTPGRFRLAHR